VTLTRITAVAGIAAVGLLAAGCGSNNNPPAATPTASGSAASASGASGCATGSLSGQGSTFQKPMEQQWAAQFAQQCSGAQVTYTGTGSGAGITQFGDGTVDFAGSDVTMKASEQAKANTRCGGSSLTIPITAGGVAVIYHLTGVSSLQLSAATLAGIFDGTIKAWNDAAIAADNPGVTLPATPIAVYHRSDGSGTTSVFTSFLVADAPTWKLGTGKTVVGLAGQGANGSDGVTAGVKQTNGGITYAEISYAEQDNLPTAKVRGTAGSYAGISSATVSEAIGSGFTVTGTGNDLAGAIDFAKVSGYPVSTVSYAIVCQHYGSAATATLVKDYLTYAVTTGQAQATQLGFAPLPSALVTRDQAALATIS